MRRRYPNQISADDQRELDILVKRTAAFLKDKGIPNLR